MNRVVKIIEKIAVFSFLGICIMVFTQVLARYLFSSPIYWAEEFTLSVFSWVAFIGAALALRKSRHARITLLTSRMPDALRVKVEIVTHFLVACVCALIFYQSIKFFDLSHTVIMTALNVPESFVSAAITFSSFFMGVFSIESAVRMILKKDNKTDSEVVV
ncbi:MAG: TRAP transporter small permease [Spirochaetales bacterium]|jgi:TRAP-type C4-dicarboxylate transport system permease small subunit|nr:TRAP transporter small permease [Spirochaetales bacterium]